MANLFSRSRLQVYVKRALSGWLDRRSAGSHLTCREVHGGRCEGWTGTRAVVSCVAGDVTHLVRTRTISPTLLQLTCTTLTQLTCNSVAALLRYCPAVASPVSSPSCHTHTLFFAHPHLFVAIVSARA